MSAARKPKSAPRVVHAAVEFVAAPAVPKRHRTRWILGDPEADAVEQEVEEHVRGRRGKDAKPTAERKAKDVERFELLAKATAKVPTVAPRKLYVDKRDGSIGEITTRDLGDKLLEREAIANETAEGVRPRQIFCATCRRTVAVSPLGGSVPTHCKPCNMFRANNATRVTRRCSDCGKQEQVKEITTPWCRTCGVVRWHKTLTDEQKAKRANSLRSAAADVPPEVRRARAANASRAAAAKFMEQPKEVRSEKSRRAGAAALAAHTTEERSAFARASKTPEVRARASTAMKQRYASMTEEERRELGAKIGAARKGRGGDAMKKAWVTRRAKAVAKKAGEQ